MEKALIVANLAGFFNFLWNDIKILEGMGYSIEVAANCIMNDGEYYPEVKKFKEKKICFYNVNFDSKNPLSPQNIRAFNQIKNILRQNKYQLIHCHTPIAGIFTRLAARSIRRHDCKVIYTTHGFAFTDTSSKKSWLIYYNIERFCSRFTDAIITINHLDFDNAKRMKCKKVFCIPGVGVDVAKYRDMNINRVEYRKSIGVQENKIMVLSVGELSQRKNHQAVIKALGLLNDKEKYVYVICGTEVVNSGMKKHLQDLARENNVNLVLLGHRLDTAQIYKCADISAIPSLREGLGLAGIEALAAGIPVIGANVQGIREYVIDSEDGYLCNPNEIESISSIIDKLSNISEETKESMYRKCVEIASKFDISVSNQKMKLIYETVLGNNENSGE
ncbi:glycosyltransferase [Sporolactobacillus spathodeae]|uniref:Glycosyltransferase involved in cell wall biosynthesis n=1 Tax=Sporolactobacillus spathodeae TaxID=1465502 RepID=A0ABS2Q8V0_9BACL|nr:glycosyltransferase [Sporolactobacillus spathodeae]MBM7657755.1 glycosyltransferase involved in cell wall biosynthesis [Sporolactobacillus spathodeae]